MSQVIVFTDLDDTLIQTRRKLPENASFSLGATDKEGLPLSFMTKSQETMLKIFSQSDAIIIPVTGRNTSALDRVAYAFNHYRVVSHGALVLQKNGDICTKWLEKVAHQFDAWKALMFSCNEEILSLIKDYQLNARSRVITDHDIDVYVSVKGEPEALTFIREHNTHGQHFTHHENAHNYALLPPYASKKKAVEHIHQMLNLGADHLIIGLGDSLSDLEFMTSCQFAMFPQHSQIKRSFPYA
ncbi:MAG: hypothetical protein Q9M15_03460 [Mariprofundaceae bacterium]|nr:hypothetical protein [Mariprofundaceae bacterium]